MSNNALNGSVVSGSPLPAMPMSNTHFAGLPVPGVQAMTAIASVPVTSTPNGSLNASLGNVRFGTPTTLSHPVTFPMLPITVPPPCTSRHTWTPQAIQVSTLHATTSSRVEEVHDSRQNSPNQSGEAVQALNARLAKREAHIQELEDELQRSSALVAERDERIARLERQYAKLQHASLEPPRLQQTPPGGGPRRSNTTSSTGSARVPGMEEVYRRVSDPLNATRTNNITDVPGGRPSAAAIDTGAATSRVPSTAFSGAVEVYAGRPASSSPDPINHHRNSPNVPLHAGVGATERRPRVPGSGSRSPVRRTSDHMQVDERPSTGMHGEMDEIDQMVQKHLEERPAFDIEVEKVKKGWYMFGKPIGKKVYVRLQSTTKGTNAVVRVGGGYKELGSFLDEHRLGPGLSSIGA